MIATPPAATARTTSKLEVPMALRRTGSCVGVAEGVRERDVDTDGTAVTEEVDVDDGEGVDVADDVAELLGVVLGDAVEVAPADFVLDVDAVELGVLCGVRETLAVLLADAVVVAVEVVDGAADGDAVGVADCDALTGTMSTCMKPEPAAAVASSVYPEPTVALESCVVS